MINGALLERFWNLCEKKKKEEKKEKEKFNEQR